VIDSKIETDILTGNIQHMKHISEAITLSTESEIVYDEDEEEQDEDNTEESVPISN